MRRAGRPTLAERGHRLLLRLYPASFRERFGEDIADFHRDRMRAERVAGRRGPVALWAALARDLVASAALEHARELQLRARARREGRAARAHVHLHHDREDQEMLGSIRQDLRYAARGLVRKPTFTVVVLATLALGIGANAAIFSVVRGVLLRPFLFRDAGRLVAFQHEDPYWTVSEPEFADYRRAGAFERLAAYAGTESNLTAEDGEAERVRVARVSDGFFSVLGVPAQRGRTFAPEEETHRVVPVVVISHGLWQRRFGADADVVGKTLRLNGQERTIIGVMPPHFDYPAAEVAVWSPLRLNYDSLWTRNNHYLALVGRLASGVTVERARAELQAMANGFARDYPDIYAAGKPMQVSVKPVAEDILGPTRPYLLALSGAVGLVLLIACANVANLMLARGEGRRKELAIRTALGASRARLARQVLTESALLALAGGALGLLLAGWGLRVLLALAPSSIPRLDQVGVDPAVVAFTFGASLAAGLLFGLIPALRGARGDSSETLKEGGKTSGQGASQRRTRGLLIVSEVALAVVTLVGAGLLVRSLLNLQAIDLGFRPEGVLTARVSPQPDAYTDERSVELYRQLLVRLSALPGVRAAAAAGSIPVANEDDSGWSIMVDGRVLKNISESPTAKPVQVTPDYFRALGVPIVRGRGFTEADREGAPYVAIVNEAMARELWPGRDPVGRTIKMFDDEAPWVTIVGVAGDVRSRGFQDDVPPTMFFPYAQAGKSAYFTPRAMTLVLRAGGDPLALAPALRAAARELDLNAPVTAVRSMEHVVAASIASRRYSTLLLTSFAALALALSGIGIYGVIAYTVSQRTYEIGLRLALGARPASVLALVMGQGARMALAGLALGLAAALAVTRLLRSLLVDVGATDPATLAAVAAALFAVAAIATLLPARRAMRVSAIEALRSE